MPLPGENRNKRGGGRRGLFKEWQVPPIPPALAYSSHHGGTARTSGFPSLLLSLSLAFIHSPSSHSSSHPPLWEPFNVLSVCFGGKKANHFNLTAVFRSPGCRGATHLNYCPACRFTTLLLFNTTLPRFCFF